MSAPKGVPTPKRRDAIAQRRANWPTGMRSRKSLPRIESLVGDGKVIDYIGHNRSRKQRVSS